MRQPPYGPLRMADDPSGLEPSAIISIVPAEMWTLKADHYIDGRHHWRVRRNGEDIGVIAEQDTGMLRGVRWFWSLHRLHKLGHFMGYGSSLDECKLQLKEQWDRLVKVRGIKKIEAALLPRHAQPMTRPFRPPYPYAKPWPAR